MSASSVSGEHPRRAFLDTPHPVAFAHRGGARLFPENTLVAFEGALALGVRYLETDLHLSRDGEIVVFHDATLERTTNATGPVADRTLAELKSLDAAYWFSPDGESYPLRGTGVTIPTLEELWALDGSLYLNVELKRRGEELGRALLTFIELHDAHHRFLVAAAHDATAQAFRALSGGEVATGAGARECFAFWGAVQTGTWRWWRERPYDALQVPPVHGPLTVIDRRFVEAAHALGVEVHAWTIDRPEEMRRLLALGVDGLMSDRPDYLAQVVRAHYPLGGPHPG